MNDADSPSRTYGVLFIHGVGEQARGETLIRGSEPLVQWLTEWLKFVKGLKPTIPSQPASTTQRGEDDDLLLQKTVLSEVVVDQPAHTVVQIPLDVSRRSTTSHDTWLMAESHWAKSFEAASLSEVVPWLISVGPVLIYFRLYRLVTEKADDLVGKAKAGSSAVRRDAAFIAVFLMRALAAIVCAVALTHGALSAFGSPTGWIVPALVLPALLAFAHLAVTATMLILALAQGVAALRIAVISDIAKVIGNFIGRYLGDGYVAVFTRLSQSAILSKVRRDIAWLWQQNCERVFVIAHSQGAFLWRRIALQPFDTVLPGSAITYGSGVQTLEALRELSKQKRRSLRIQLTCLLTGCAPVIAGSAAFALLGESVITAAIIGVLGIVCTSVQLRAMRDHIDKMLPDLEGSTDTVRVNRRKRYGTTVSDMSRDVYARLDIATEGRLVHDDLRKQRVRNQESPILDHISFWDNHDQFVPYVNALLFQDFFGRPLADTDSERAVLRKAWIVRNLRSDCLYIISLLALMSSLAFGLSHSDAIFGQTQQIQFGLLARQTEALFATGLQETVRSVLGWLDVNPGRSVIVCLLYGLLSCWIVTSLVRSWDNVRQRDFWRFHAKDDAAADTGGPSRPHGVSLRSVDGLIALGIIAIGMLIVAMPWLVLMSVTGAVTLAQLSAALIFAVSVPILILCVRHDDDVPEVFRPSAADTGKDVSGGH